MKPITTFCQRLGERHHLPHGRCYHPTCSADCKFNKDMIMDEKPIIVTLCGSTRHKDVFKQAMRSETLAGKIVLTVGMWGHEEGLDMAGQTKRMLDQLHFRKIDISDEVLILNVGGYVGLSTCDEYHYALSQGKHIRFWEACD